MTSTRTLLTFMAPAVLWLAGCAAGPGGWGSAPGNTQHEYEAAQRGQSSSAARAAFIPPSAMTVTFARAARARNRSGPSG